MFSFIKLEVADDSMGNQEDSGASTDSVCCVSALCSDGSFILFVCKTEPARLFCARYL